MPPTLTGRVFKSRKSKTGLTPHQKNHRWESFSNKVSKLHSLDPLRRVRRHDLDTEDLESTTSYLRNGLEKWAELNLSKGFTSFKRELQPLCDSLPQILHFEGRIMDLLEKYISAQDLASLEPLLDLLNAFAHDLGTRFEKHYPRALSLIIQIASRPQDAAVIEWTFACLAFLFKYLSKLLVPDLRPTYDLLAPLLGKARNPAHITRFAAEALSFLVKKAAAPANREKALVPLIQHIRDDFTASRDNRHLELYYHGLMAMFAEAVKGQGNGIHTTGPDILKALLLSVPNDQCLSLEPINWSEIVCGVFVSIVHHTTAETFLPIPKAVSEAATSDKSRSGFPLRNVLYVRCLGIISGVRKGTRIDDWQPILGSLLQCLESISRDSKIFEMMESTAIWQQLLVNTAIIWQLVPMDILIPYITEFTTVMTREPLMSWFIPYCSYFSELDSTRFRSIFLKPFQKFVIQHWSESSNEDMLCVFIPRMIESRALPSVGEADAFSLPQSWQDQIVSKFERLEISPFPEEGASSAYDKDPKTWRDKCLPKYSALLRLLELTSVRPSTIGPIANVLLRKLKLALRPSQSALTEEARFIVSQGFSAYLRMSKACEQLDTSLAPLLRAATPRYYRLTGFLEAMLLYETTNSRDENRSPQSQSEESVGHEGDLNPFLQCLVQSLSMPLHDHRLASLRLLSKLDSAPDELDCLSLMCQIEETPVDLQNSRVLSMHMRSLGVAYANLSESSWLRHAIPSFLFGLMTVRMTPIWDSAVEALQKISHTKSGEDAISDIAFKWIDVPSKRWEGPSKGPTNPPYFGSTDFECTNLSSLRVQAEETDHVISNSAEIILENFERAQEAVPDTPPNARSQALKVFSSASALAEKKSRKLVPIFLSWSSSPEQGDIHDEVGEEEVDRSWSLFDKKAMIGVFAQFSNPKVLFQSQQVYEALLILLSNGDIEVQKSALKAILTWKQEGVQPYQESLEYLLDEARFRNELTVLFQGDKQIQPEHRSEAMPVLLRLLYGRTISKKGIASGRHGLQANRLAVLRHLTVEDMGNFLDIALGSLRNIQLAGIAGLQDDIFQREFMPIRKQVGFINMMGGMINELGTNVENYMDRILPATLHCLVSACRILRKTADESEEVEEVGELPAQISLLRNVRTTSLKCVISLLQNTPKFDWTPYRDVLVKETISPRLDKLDVENTQGVSGVLQLLSTISLLPKTALFFAADGRIIRKLMDLVAFPKAKDDVRIFSLVILQNLIKVTQMPATQCEFNELIAEEIIEPNVNLILDTVGQVLKTEENIGKDLLLACVETVVELSPMVRQCHEVGTLINVAVFLLDQPSKIVNPKTKSVIVLMLEKFLALEGMSYEADLLDRIYSTIASLFSFFRDRTSRETLSNVLTILIPQVNCAPELSELCASINAFRRNRVDEPDYDRRLAAFNAISKPRDPAFTSRDWEPLIHNMIFYIRHDEEYGVLSANSADGLCTFIDAVASSTSEEDGFRRIMSAVILPSLYSNAKEPSETVRRETMKVMGYLVSRMPSWTQIADLVPLNPEPDEKDPEPSFFGNILNPAAARQMRALQLLSKVTFHNTLSSRHVAQLFIPLLEHFIFNRPEGSDDHGVGAQAATTIADLSFALEWPQYRAILRRYIGYIETKPDAQKQLVRLLGKFVDTLTATSNESKSGTMDVDNAKPHLASTLPAPKKFNEDVISNILPPLLNYMHEKDEATVSSRVPVGIIVVKVLKLLPEESLNQKLPGVLTDICHILRSKALESREMARDTLSKMTLLLGPSYFGFVLKELRGALTSGYQLHVLSYTMHTILVTVIPQFQPGDIDYCLDDIMAIIMDDIFGVVGQEKDATEYTSKTKEVKSSKSQDSMELIARTASVNRLGDLISPLRSLLLEKLDLRMVRKIDELLSRIATGLLGNSAAESRDTLIFCYQVVQQVYASQQAKAEPILDPKIRRYLVQKGAKRSGERSTTSKYTYKLVRFAVDVLRAVFKKHDSLRNSTNITGFIPMLGDAVVGGEDEVKVSTFKLLNVLTKVPFKNEDASKLYRVAAKEATKCISASTSFASDLTQASLKLMSVILRDRPDVLVKDAAVDMLLGKLKDDLTEPLYRHVTFNFLRSVLDRKIATAAVYDILDYVGGVMITNDDKNTRDLARGAFFQFLRDYPQKKNRWAKQLSFIVANLQYEREGGRLSVMEVIHLLLMKSADDFVQEVNANCFIPLILVLANDDSEKCRLAAAELIKEIFRKADKERTSKFLTLARNWLEQDGNPSVLQLAVRSFALYFEAREPSLKDKKDLDRLLGALVTVLNNISTLAKESDLMLVVLQTIPILIIKHPAIVLSNDELWRLSPVALFHSDASVKTSAAQLITTYLTDFQENNKNAGNTQRITGSCGLQLDEVMLERLITGAVSILNPGIVARWKKKQGKKLNAQDLSFVGSEVSPVQEAADLDEALATDTSRIILMLSKYLDAGTRDAKDTLNLKGEGESNEEEASEDETERDDLDDQDQNVSEQSISLYNLCTWLSDILIEETRPRAATLVPKVAALDIASILVGTLPAEKLRPSLHALLIPLHQLTDPSVPIPSTVDDAFKTRHEALRTKATEIMDVLQRKLGTAAYTAELLAVRERARRRREGRSRKRKIEAVTQPERFGKWKRGRLDKKVKSRKEKGIQNRNRRHQY